MERSNKPACRQSERESVYLHQQNLEAGFSFGEYSPTRKPASLYMRFVDTCSTRSTSGERATKYHRHGGDTRQSHGKSARLEQNDLRSDMIVQISRLFDVHSRLV